MNLISRKHWRIAAAAVTAAMILAPAAALAAPGQHTAPAAASAPGCATSDLMVWLGIPGDGTAGSTYYELELSNISHHTCTLFGFPGVSAVNRSGAQLGSPAPPPTSSCRLGICPSRPQRASRRTQPG